MIDIYLRRLDTSFVLLKGKEHKNINDFLLNVFAGKTAHFNTNCMKIGFLFVKILRFYVFKMAANDGRHFEINIKTENQVIKFNVFLKGMHTHI